MATAASRMPIGQHRRRVGWEVGVCLLVAVAGYWIGSASFTRYVKVGGLPEFYQSQFAPALMEACGRGFSAYSTEPAAESADRFLAADGAAFLEAKRLDCDELVGAVLPKPANPLQRISRYLMFAVAWCWRLWGVSWQSVIPLFGLLCGLTALGAYLLARSVGPPVVALAVTFLFVTSPVHLGYLPHLRDYSKAPFVLLSVAAAAWMMRAEVTKRGIVGLAAVAGAVLGVGLGFRSDLLVAGAPVAAAIVLSPLSVPRAWRARLLALVALGASFGGTAGPILTAHSEGSNSYHVILLGLTREFDTTLGVSTPVYSFGHFYNDGYLTAVAQDHAVRVRNVPNPGFATRAFDIAGRDVLMAVALNFPADVVIRAYASLSKVANAPFFEELGFVNWTNRSTGRPWLDEFYRLRTSYLIPMGGSGLWFSAGFLALMAARSFRLGLWWSLVVAFFGTLPAMQFHIRHYFHLEVLGWLAILTVVALVVATARSVFRGRPVPSGDDQAIHPLGRVAGWGRMIALLGGVSLVAAAVLTSARAYQQGSATRLLSVIEGLPRTRIESPWVPADEGRVRFRLPPPTETNTVMGYFGIELATGCPFIEVPVRLNYATPVAFNDYSEELRILVQAPDETVRLFFPVVWMAGGPIPEVSLDTARDVLPCIGQVFNVSPGQTPLLPYLYLSDNWRRERLYQVRERGQLSALGARSRVPVWVSSKLDGLKTSDFTGPLDPVFSTPPTFQVPIAAPAGEGWRIKGSAKTRFAYFLQSAAVHRPKGALLVATGDVRTGGFTLGFLRDDQWAAQVSVNGPGPFRAALSSPDDGDYALVVAANLPGRSLEADIDIARIGWVQRPADGP